MPLPHTRNFNPTQVKGVIFDTDGGLLKDEGIWYMCEQARVAASTDYFIAVNCLQLGDTVFLYHKCKGIIAAGKVKGKIEKDLKYDALYWELDWLTAHPTREGGTIKAMPTSEVTNLLKRDIYWARIAKWPFLSPDEAKQLLEAVISYIGSPSELSRANGSNGTP
jgi:hypothetical protein